MSTVMLRLTWLLALALAACGAVRPTPVPPRVAVDTVQLAVTPTGETRLRVSLDVSNPNPYDIPIASIDASFRIEDAPVATALLAKPVTLPASGQTFVEIEARPDFNAMRQVLDRVLRKLAAHYEVSGAAVLQNGIRLPFAKSGDLPIGDLLGKIR